MTSLDGRAVVVTGAGRGLGEAFAVQLGLAGAMVVVNDVDGDAARRTAAAIRAQGHPAVASDHTVSDPEQAQRTLEGIGLTPDQARSVLGKLNTPAASTTPASRPTWSPTVPTTAEPRRPIWAR